MRSIQTNPMIFMSDRLSVAFSFSRRAHLLTTRKRAVVWPSATVRSPRGIAAPAGAAGRCHSPVGAAVIVHAAGSAVGWQNATLHSLPSACANLPPAASRR